MPEETFLIVTPAACAALRANLGAAARRHNQALRKGGDVDVYQLGDGRIAVVHVAPEKLTEAECEEIAQIVEAFPKRKQRPVAPPAPAPTEK